MATIGGTLSCIFRFRLKSAAALVMPPHRGHIFRDNRSDWFPAEQQQEEPDIPLKEALDFTVFKKQTKMFIEEKLDNVWRKRELFLPPDHNEQMIQWKFDNPETFDEWGVMADSDRKQGYSKCELLMSKNKTAIFRGVIDTTVPKDGRTVYAGFSSMKSKRLYKPFFRKASYCRWTTYSHFLIKVRGDGRKYTLVLNTPGYWDHEWHAYYTFPLYTHGGPYWQYEKIPFSKFYKACHGRIQDRQFPVFSRKLNPKENMYAARANNYSNDISSIAISLFDKVDGPFQLEIDYIGAYYDETHFEEFAYESYKMPFAFK